MGDLLGVTASELVERLRARRARLPFEIGAFVALEACEALLRAPAVVTAQDVRVSDDGRVTVYAPPNSASSEEAARSLVDLLAHLLVAAGAEVPPSMLSLVEQGPRRAWELPSLRDELESCLVPLNRGAARRVLSRLLREVERRPSAYPGAAPPALAEDEVDDELDALLGAGGHDIHDAPTRELVAPDDDNDAGLDEFEEEVSTLKRDPTPSLLQDPEEDAVTAPRAAVSERTAEVALVGARAPAPAPAPAPARPAPTPTPAPPSASGMPDLDGFEEVSDRSGGRALLWAVLFLLLIGGVAGAVFVLRPDIVARLRGDVAEVDPLEAQRAAEAAVRADAVRRAEEERRQRYGDLVVRVTPERAQVLLFVGRGPTVARNLPLGVAHEMVAIADGKAPTRAVIPPDAEWESSDEGPLYELAMQTGEEAMDFEHIVLGDTRLPRDVGTPRDTLGRVRVITTPRGARVYQLIGFSPNVRVRNLDLAAAPELLVYHEGYAPRRLVVAPSDFVEGEDGIKVAEVDVTLEAR